MVRYLSINKAQTQMSRLFDFTASKYLELMHQQAIFTCSTLTKLDVIKERDMHSPMLIAREQNLPVAGLTCNP